MTPLDNVCVSTTSTCSLSLSLSLSNPDKYVYCSLTSLFSPLYPYLLLSADGTISEDYNAEPATAPANPLTLILSVTAPSNAQTDATITVNIDEKPPSLSTLLRQDVQMAVCFSRFRIIFHFL